MYVDNEIFEKWMEKLDGGISEAIKYLKSLVNTNEVFDRDEKLLDNYRFMLYAPETFRNTQNLLPHSGRK